MSWFRMSVGRQKNADPRWLLPLICRLGHLTKKDIGAIRIFDRESRFEIAEEAVERFNAALAKAGKDEVRIRPDAGPSGGSDAKPARPAARAEHDRRDAPARVHRRR